MEIRIEDFISPEIRKTENFKPQIVDSWLIDYEGYKNNGDIYVNAHFTKTNADILMQAEIKGNIIGVCSRCLEEAIIPIDTDLTIMFIPSNQQRKYAEDEEVELTSDELDVEYYKGNKIDVDYLFRESVLLSIPYSPLCKESCKGLCPICGGNLNLQKCTCKNKSNVFNNIKLNLF